MLRLRDAFILAPTSAGVAEYGSIVNDKSGRTWVLWNSRLSLLQGTRLVPFAGDLAGEDVQGICCGRDGGLWVITGGHMREWEDSGWGNDLGHAPWGSDGANGTFLETRDGQLAAGVVDHGLHLIQPDHSFVCYNRTNGLPSDWVRTLCEDREGDLWTGTGNGLAVLRAGKVAVVDAPDQWQSRAVLSIDNGRDGSMWVGTEGAGLYRFDRTGWSRFSLAQGVSNSYVWSVSEDAQNRLWAGTWGGGLLVQQGEHFQRVAGLEDLRTPVLALLHSDDGTTWAGTQDGLLHYQQGKVDWYGRNKSLVYPDVRAVVQDAEGAVWFGMFGGGLGVAKNGTVRQFRRSDGLSSDFVQCLKVEKGGRLWVGTFGGGLTRLNQGKFASVSTAQGLPNDVICDIEDDGHGFFWFSSHGGIFRVSKQLLNQCADGLTNSVRCLSYGKGDGLPTLECSGGFQPAGSASKDGRLWFPTSKGLVVVDPNEISLNHLPPPVVLEDLLVNGQPMQTLSGGDPVRIPAGDNRLEFRYTGLSFAAPEKVRFQYKLEGLDPQWVDAGTKRSANYSYIPPGRYTFHVIACNNDDIWNETGQTLAITVLPHFWQTWWFMAANGVVLATALGGGVWFETRRRMRWKVERLERERAVERERTRIAKDIHDDLGASLTRITLLSQTARHDLGNPVQAAANLDRIYATAVDLTRAMDEIVWAVNPRHDTLESLASYFGSYAQDFLAAANMSCRLDLSVHLPGWPLTAEIRHNLFLAFKEVLHNVVKHSGATEVRVSLALPDSVFCPGNRGNGRGFAAEAPAAAGMPGPERLVSGNGLANVRRRLAKIGGHCEIQSAPGQGTQIQLIVPVSASDREAGIGCCRVGPSTGLAESGRSRRSWIRQATQQMKTSFHKSRACCLLLSFMFVFATWGSDSPPRERLLMDFGWKFHMGNESGSAQNLAKAGTGSGPASRWFSDASWRAVNLPHDWAIELPFDPNAEGSHGF